MAADLHIHVMEGCSESDLSIFFSHTLGSKWAIPLGRSVFGNDKTQSSKDKMQAAKRRVIDTPNVWVGEVSWLKAAFFGDEESFIPTVVQKVSEIIGEELPVIDDRLIQEISNAFKSSSEHEHYQTTDIKSVLAFLEEHRGKQVFTVSW